MEKQQGLRNATSKEARTFKEPARRPRYRHWLGGDHEPRKGEHSRKTSIPMQQMGTAEKNVPTTVAIIPAVWQG